MLKIFKLYIKKKKDKRSISTTTIHSYLPWNSWWM